MSRPENKEQLHAEIVDAVAGLDKENTELWTKDKTKAQTSAISGVLGYDVTAAERDAAVPPLKLMKQEASAAAKAIAGLKISSSKQGFRRAGFSFGKEPVEIPLSDLSKEQVNMLKNEPLLAVAEITIKADAE